MKAILFLLLSFGFPSGAFAQCDFTPRYSAQFRTTALDLSVDGNFVWVATGYGVQLYDGTTLADSIAVPGNTRVIEADRQGLAYAGSGSSIYVIRRDGLKLSIVRAVPAGGTVNDLHAGTYLFAATSQGIGHFDLVDRTNPARTAVTLQTSSPNVTSLAVNRTTLYAADGDTTVETFSIAAPSLPQHTGVLEAMPRASAVHTANDFLYVSDHFGQTTDVFSGVSRVARLPLGTTSLAASPGHAHFVAGRDRNVRAVDFTTLDRVAKLYELQLAPTEGTDNVIHDLARNGDTLFVAAGDIGLVLVDVASIRSPYPIVSYGSGMTTSVRTAGDRAWFSDASGTISEQRIDANGLALAETRNWSAGSGALIRDHRDNGLLTSSGNTATLWALVSSTPAAAVTATFENSVIAAVSADTQLVALLANGSVWTVSGAQAAPQKVDLPPMSLLARDGAAIVMAEVRESEFTTVLHYWADGNLAAQPRSVTVNGATTAIAVEGARAAVFSFAGISVADFDAQSVRVIRGSARVIPRQLAYQDGDLLVLDLRRLLVYEDAMTLVAERPLPADAVAIDTTGTIAALATNEGVAAISYLAQLPAAETPFASSFYTRVAAGENRLYLLDRGGVTIFNTVSGEAPAFIARLRVPGIVDLAASDDALFTISANGTLSAWSPVGTPLAEMRIDEGIDAQPLALAAVGPNALWLALSHGCSTGNCQRKTMVFDGASLANTATLAGSFRDVTVSGSRAYALFDTPNDMRVYDLADPVRPAQLVSAPRHPSARSIAAAQNLVHVLGEKLYSYTESTLAPAGERFTAIVPDDAQRIRIAGNCAIVTGRGETPELHALPSFAPVTTHEVPSNVRAVAISGDRVLLLTGHSLEIWSSQPATPPSKRRVVR